MFAFSALVAGSFSLGSRVANDIDPLALTALRFLLASVLIGTIGVYLGAFNRAALRATWRYAVLGGLMGGYFVLMFTGLKTATPTMGFSSHQPLKTNGLILEAANTVRAISDLFWK